MARTKRGISGLLSRSPIVWGCLGAAAFYGLVNAGPLSWPVVLRYFTHHPVEYGETFLFAIGLAALIIRLVDIVRQRAGLGESLLGEELPAKATLRDKTDTLLARLDQVADGRQGDFYPRRLRAAVERIRRAGSAEGLDDELKYLADADGSRQQNGYALFRVIVWAIPILGFLGTVIGITMALNGLRPEALDESMLDVTTGLGVKFDTTALALSMSMLLMFLHFFVERADHALLERVDLCVEEDLMRHFDAAEPRAPEGRLSDSAIRTFERLVERQTNLWHTAMQTAEQRWQGMAAEAAEQIERAVVRGLSESVAAHARQLTASEQTLLSEHRQWLTESQLARQGEIDAAAAIQAAMLRQADVLQRAVAACGEIGQLQSALNGNLAALAGAKHIEQTVLGLAAAVHLLNARLAEAPGTTPSIHLDSVRPDVKAA